MTMTHMHITMMLIGIFSIPTFGFSDDRLPFRSSASQLVADTAPPLSEGVAGKTDREKAIFDKFIKQESDFKQHYDAHYLNSGYGYNQYRPAYQHGFELGVDPRYSSTDWNSMESQARRTWNESKMGLWDQYKDAVRFGWERGVQTQKG
ncbi:MAG TPA: hypothetical protein VH681_13660 [Nitrospiraceae bacterium]|jgi:hypothetical protein